VTDGRLGCLCRQITSGVVISDWERVGVCDEPAEEMREPLKMGRWKQWPLELAVICSCFLTVQMAELGHLAVST